MSKHNLQAIELAVKVSDMSPEQYAKYQKYLKDHREGKGPVMMKRHLNAINFHHQERSKPHNKNERHLEAYKLHQDAYNHMFARDSKHGRLGLHPGEHSEANMNAFLAHDKANNFSDAL